MEPEIQETPIQEQPPLEIVEEQETEEVQPTKSVKNFWERLDEVFQQNTDLRDKMNALVEQFPEFAAKQNQFTSAVFQPERIAISSNDDIQPSTQAAIIIPDTAASGLNLFSHQPAELFSSFRIRLQRPLRNVKSIQLLSGTIPNATQNLPDDQCIFYYYRLRTVQGSVQGNWNPATIYGAGDFVLYGADFYVCKNGGANNNPTTINWQEIIPTPLQLQTNQIVEWDPFILYLPNTIVLYQSKYYICVTANIDIPPTRIFWVYLPNLPAATRPNYYDLNPEKIYNVYIKPTLGVPYEGYAANTQLQFNRTFETYQDINATMNACANTATQASIQGDLTFLYDQLLNKIQVIGEDYVNYFYLPCGYEDSNLESAIDLLYSARYLLSNLSTTLRLFKKNQIFTKNYTLNLRLGFTWNGIFPNPFTTVSYDDIAKAVYWYLRAKDPGLNNFPAWTQNLLTANNYPDLVNTSCVRVYADFAFSSTQDSIGTTNSNQIPFQQGLLSIVPVNTSNLGVGFYQNNFNNPLTKIPQNITEIGINLFTDQGTPFLLPNSATVLLELAIEYN